MTHSSRVIAARWILPVSSDPIQGGWMRLGAGQILEIGAGHPPGDAVDLGDVAVLPALVNAHTHLEFSDLSAPIGHPGIPLHQWIGQVVTTRRDSTPQSRPAAIQAGINELRDSGTCLAGEITTPPCAYPASAGAPQLVTFAEVLGLDRQRADQRFRAAVQHADQAVAAGFSPHAPYSTTPHSIKQCVTRARQLDRAVAMHVAESPDERELLSRGSGPFAQALKAMGVWRTGIFPWGEAPLDALIQQLSRAPAALLIHGNYLYDDEIACIARQPQLSIVYCPRTHHFFGHQVHPVARMIAAGVRVALGTDSRASSPDLNLWHEVQFLLRHRIDLDPLDVLTMATKNGADALRQPRFGRLQVGAAACLGYVRTAAASRDDLYADLAQNRFRPIGPDETL